MKEIEYQILKDWDSLPGESLVPLGVMLKIISIKKSTAYARMQFDPAFPQRIYIGEPDKRSTIRFRKSDIIKYLLLLEDRSKDPKNTYRQESKGGRKKKSRE